MNKHVLNRICDRCGRPILQGELRYLAKIEIYAAYDPLEITAEDLARDTSRELEQLLRQCEQLTEAELMRDVHVAYQFDLCRGCQQRLVQDPLGAPPGA
jgi:hypothetical protein